MRNISKQELNKIIDNHKLWLSSGGEKGERANLSYADLSSANLSSANLSSANLSSANLSSADLDYSAFPLWCGGLNVHIDDKQATQIIKALELCHKVCSHGNLTLCKKCPLYEEKCSVSLPNYALALIKELTEENKAWQMQLISQEEKSGKAYYDLACEVEDLRAENANLHASCTELTQKCASLTEENKVRKGLNTMLDNELRRLGEENERLRGVGIPDNEAYIRLSDAKHAIMEYACNQTVSKYASAEICKAVRNGAEGAMNELDYMTPVKVAPIADTVRKLQNELKKTFSAICKGEMGDLYRIIDQIAKEIMEENK